MSRIKELAGIARERLDNDRTVKVGVALGEDEDFKTTLDVLVFYFGEDDERQAVRLFLRGQDVGYLTREDLFAYIDTSLKHLGSGAHSRLPGEGRYQIVKLCCPVGGCDERLNVILFNEDHPPKCPEHPESAMEVCG